MLRVEVWSVAVTVAVTARRARRRSGGTAADRRTIAFFTRNRPTVFRRSARRRSAGQLNVSVVHFVPRADSIPSRWPGGGRRFGDRTAWRSFGDDQAMVPA